MIAVKGNVLESYLAHAEASYLLSSICPLSQVWLLCASYLRPFFVYHLRRLIGGNVPDRFCLLWGAPGGQLGLSNIIFLASF